MSNVLFVYSVTMVNVFSIDSLFTGKILSAYSLNMSIVLLVYGAFTGNV